MQIKPNIYNVGVNGNNAYLITGEKTTLIDTVAKYRSTNLLENIEKIIPVSELDYLILNHTEQDKSGAVGAILKKNPGIEVIATVAGLRNLKEMLNCEFNEHVAKDNNTLELGGLTLKFLITPNINWPDSMVTYEENTKTLFSCDLFSEYGEDPDYLSSLYSYYAENLRANNEYVKNGLERVSELSINALCPGYGKNGDSASVNEAFKLYESICKGTESIYKAAVIYSTMYEDTEEMAECIRKTLEDKGLKCAMADATTNLYGYDTEELLKADAFVIGTYTKNHGADVELLEFLANAEPYLLRHKPFFTFGSYGWSGEGPQIVHNLLKSYGMKPFSKPFMSIFNMSDEKRAELIQHTQKFARFISEENSK